MLLAVPDPCFALPPVIPLFFPLTTIRIGLNAGGPSAHPDTDYPDPFRDEPGKEMETAAGYPDHELPLSKFATHHRSQTLAGLRKLIRSHRLDFGRESAGIFYIVISVFHSSF